MLILFSYGFIFVVILIKSAPFVFIGEKFVKLVLVEIGFAYKLAGGFVIRCKFAGLTFRHVSSTSIQ